MEYKKGQFDEKVLNDFITKEQWVSILKDGNLVGLKDMKILLDLYSNYGKPIKRALIGEGLEFSDVDMRIQNMCKRIAKELDYTFCENDIGSFQYKFRYWFIMLDGMNTKDEKGEPCFVWNLKKEVKEAIDSLLFN